MTTHQDLHLRSVRHRPHPDRRFAPSECRLQRTIQYARETMMSTGRCFWVYILASRLGGTLYIGVTNDLIRRVYEHRTDAVPGFTNKYQVHRLVYYEQFSDIENAIRREKRLKKWDRAWKIQLIAHSNPNWDDLYPSIAIP